MNTLMFLSGMGVGALLTVILLLACMRLTMARNKKWNQDTLDLMRERNEIAKERLNMIRAEKGYGPY